MTTMESDEVQGLRFIHPRRATHYVWGLDRAMSCVEKKPGERELWATREVVRANMVNCSACVARAHDEAPPTKEQARDTYEDAQLAKMDERKDAR